MAKKLSHKISSATRGQKIVLAFVCIIAGVFILLIILQLSFSWYFNDRVKTYLQTELQNQTKGEYELYVDKLTTNFFNQSVCLDEMVLIPNRAVNPKAAKYFAEAKKIQFLDFKIWKYIFGKNLEFAEVRFVEPQAKVYKSKKPEHAPEEPFSSYRAISKHLNSLAVKKIEIKNTDIDFYEKANDSLPSMESSDNLLTIKNLKIDEASGKQKKLFAADKLELTINNFEYRTLSKLYTLKIRKVVASSTDSMISMDSLKLIPAYDKSDFGYKAGKQTDRMDISVKFMQCKKMDVKLFFESNAFIAKEAFVDRLSLKAFRDKNVPEKPVVKKSLQRMIKDIPFFVHVGKVIVKDAYVSYEEIPPKREKAGLIFFEDIDAVFTGLTNDTLRMTGKSFLVMNATCRFMNEAHLLAKYAFPLQTDSTEFDCSGKMTNFPLVKINPALEPLARLSVKEGFVDTIVFNFHANARESNGKLLVRYHDFKINLMRDEKKKNIQRAWEVVTLPSKRILAAILIKNDNPKKNKEPRVTEIKEKRNPYKFIFSYTWKSILSGIKPAVGMPSKTKKINEPPPL